MDGYDLKEWHKGDDKITQYPQLPAISSLQKRSCHYSNKNNILGINQLLHHNTNNLQRIPLPQCSFKPPRPTRQQQTQRHSSMKEPSSRCLSSITTNYSTKPILLSSLKSLLITDTTAHSESKEHKHTQLSPLKKSILTQNNSMRQISQIKQVISNGPTQNQVKPYHSFSDHSVALPIVNKNKATNINNLISADSFDADRTKFRFSKTQVFSAKPVNFENQETMKQASKMAIIQSGDNELSRNQEIQENFISPNDLFNQKTFRIRPFNQQLRCDSPQYHEEQRITQEVLSNAATFRTKRPSTREIETNQEGNSRCLQRPLTHKNTEKLRVRRPSFEVKEKVTLLKSSKDQQSGYLAVNKIPKTSAYLYVQVGKNKNHQSENQKQQFNQHRSNPLICIPNQWYYDKSDFECRNSKETLNNSIINNCKSDIRTKTQSKYMNTTKIGNGSSNSIIENKEQNNQQNNENHQNILEITNSICNHQVQKRKKTTSDQQEKQLQSQILAATQIPHQIDSLNDKMIIEGGKVFQNQQTNNNLICNTNNSSQSKSAKITYQEIQHFEAPRARNFKDVELREMLGQGAYGKVFKGFIKKTGKFIAVKQLKLSWNTRLQEKNQEVQSKLQQYQKEIMLLNHLDHPHIVRYYDCISSNDHLYIYMEQMSGGSISSMLEKFGRFDEALIRKFAKQISLGVAYLHKQNVVHRDIKGANILSDGNGIVKLADFGAARYQDTLCLPSVSGSEFCQSIKGSLYWMAPELLNQEPHGRKSDIWSLGCTIIEMATAKHPWVKCKTVPELIQAVQNLRCPPIPEELSENCKDFVRKCCTFDKKARPSAEFLLNHSFLANQQ